MKSLGWFSFANNILTSVDIPPKTTSIGEGSFNNNLLPNNQAFIYERTGKIINGVAEINYGTIVSCGGAQKDDIIIPPSYDGQNLLKLDNNSFSSCSINSVTIPETVSEIDYYAFGNNNLSTITIPSSVNTLSTGVFGVNPLESVKIKGKSNANMFTGYGTYGNEMHPNIIFFWKEGITCIPNNTSNVTNGCITWNAQ